MINCQNCQTDVSEEPVFTICADCQSVVPLDDSEPQPSRSQVTADDLTVSICKGRYENRFTVQEAFSHLYQRTSNVEQTMKDTEERLNAIERTLEISIAQVCPTCQGRLEYMQTGILQCINCEATFPDRPMIGYSEEQK